MTVAVEESNRERERELELEFFSVFSVFFYPSSPQLALNEFFHTHTLSFKKPPLSCSLPPHTHKMNNQPE